MADNKTTTTTVATVPSGTVIATDEIGGVDYQRVKLACGPDGTATDVPVGGGVEAAALRVTVASDSTGVLSVDDNGASLTVDNAHLTSLGGAVAGTEVQVDVVAALPAGTNNIGDVDVLSLPALPAGTNNIGDVDVLTLPGVAGTVAHDSADSGNPVKTGGVARVAWPTPVAGGDRVDSSFDDVGRFLTQPYAPRDLTVHQATSITNSTSETTILTAAASTFHDLVSLIITNASATACTVTIKDDTGGTTRGIFAIAANGGGVFNFPLPLTQAATNDNWTATLSINTVTVHIVAVAVKNV